MEKIKGYIALYQQDIFVVLLVLVVGFLSFGLGFLACREANKEEVEILLPANLNVAAVGGSVESKVNSSERGKYVGSINSDKYHLPWCSGAERINEANKVWFQTETEAKDKGYSPAGNCPGLGE